METNLHPLYGDEAAVGATTLWHLKHGRTVLQLFQFAGGELEHSLRILRALSLPSHAKVLSLGSGVGGMERYWQDARPDLEFELVNKSAVQLAMSVCGGRQVCADAEGYTSPHGPFDVVVLAYMLGHVDPAKTVRSAAENLTSGGTLVVYDVFGGSTRFNSELYYNTPKITDVLRGASGLLVEAAVGGMPLSTFAEVECPWVAECVDPCLFIFRRP